LSLEHFDEKGDYRDLDNGKPVDSSGNFQDKFKFTSIDDLAPQLAESCDVARCFAAAMFKNAIGISSTPTPPPPSDLEIDNVANSFADSNFSIRELVKAIVQSPAFFR